MKKTRPAALYFFLIFAFSALSMTFLGYLLSDSREKIFRITHEITTEHIPSSLSKIKLAEKLSILRRETEKALFSHEVSVQNEAYFLITRLSRDDEVIKDEKALSFVLSVTNLVATKRNTNQEEIFASWAILSNAIDRYGSSISESSFEDITTKLNEVQENIVNDKAYAVIFTTAGMFWQFIILLVIFIIFVRPLSFIERYANNTADNSINRIIAKIREMDSLQESVQRLHATTLENKRMHKVVADEMHKAKVTAEEKSEFLSSMSHEIKTPLATITGMVHMLEKTELNDLQQQYISRLARSSFHLNELVSRVLAMSRMDANKLALELAPFDMSDLITEVASIAQPVVSKKHLRFHTYIERSVPTILIGDRLRIKEILINFTNNAIKFTSAGSIRVEVRAESIEGNKASIKFSVIDTGAGVAAEDVPMLFQRFSQLNKRLFAGSGLGLSITKGLAELMNGRVGVETSKGIGSTFWAIVMLEIPKTSESVIRDEKIEMPIEDALKEKQYQINNTEIASLLSEIYQLATNDLPTSSHLWLQHEQVLTRNIGESDAVLSDMFRGFRLHEASEYLRHLLVKTEIDEAASEKDDPSRPVILVIDDTPSNLDLFSLLFQDFATVKVTPNPDRGIKIAKEFKHLTLIILDVSMPIKNGFDVIAELKANPNTSSIPVVMISASGSEDTRRRSLASGAIDFIDRGKSPENIKAAIQLYAASNFQQRI